MSWKVLRDKTAPKRKSEAQQREEICPKLHIKLCQKQEKAPPLLNEANFLGWPGGTLVDEGGSLLDHERG